MLTGLAFGVILGILGSIIPGFQVTVIYLYIIQTQEPLFALGLIIGSYCLYSILNNSQQLIELYQASDPFFQQTLAKAKKINKVVDCIYISAQSEFAGFSFACLAGCALLITNQGEYVKTLIHNYGFIGVGFSMMLWIILILDAKNKILAALTICIAGFLGYLVSQQGDPYTFLSLGTALFVIAPGVLK